MQFKRWRLSAASPFVNAGLGLSLLFTAAACSKSEKPASKEEKSGVSTETHLTLPAVWSTSIPSGKIDDLAISGGRNALIAVTYEKGGLQLFNMEGDPVAELANFSLRAIATGKSTIADNAYVTVFPGIDHDGALKGYIYGDGLLAPAIVDLPVIEERRISGLCAAPLEGDSLMRISYWMGSSGQMLKTGRLGLVDGDFTWVEETPTLTEFPVASCAFSGNTLIASPSAVDSASLERDSFSGLVSISSDGEVLLSDETGTDIKTVEIGDGISFKAPTAPIAIEAMGTMLSGGYPGGVIVLGGETAPGEHSIVFVDPSVLTLRSE